MKGHVKYHLPLLENFFDEVCKYLSIKYDDFPFYALDYDQVVINNHICDVERYYSAKKNRTFIFIQPIGSIDDNIMIIYDGFVIIKDISKSKQIPKLLKGI